MALVDVLIPTCERKTGLATVLTSLLGQTFTGFDVIVSDQTTDAPYLDSIEIQTLVRALEWHGHGVALHRHLPRRGLAEHRQFLLEQSRAPYVHYLDDDVLLAFTWRGPYGIEPDGAQLSIRNGWAEAEALMASIGSCPGARTR